MPEAPTGTVTFLFTDIEGSTTRWEHHPEAMRIALARHDALLRQVITAHGGFIFKMVGDAVYAAFAVAADGVAAAVAGQQAVAAEQWGEVGPLRVRMALHTGAAQSRDDDYFGPTLNRVARVLSTGYGGQVLLSAATLELTRDSLPIGTSVQDLGEHALKDLLRPEHIFQLIIPDLPADFPALKSLSRRPHNLPVQPTPFLGRQQEVASVCALLSRPEVRLLTLTGPGGIGKTRLGLQVGAELADQFASGVYFVALAPVSDADLVVSAIMQTLSISEAGGQPLLGLLKTALKDKHLLLLLDNFEQVIGAAMQVAALLVACPTLKILVTSRVVLHVQAEREWAVPPLALPDPTHLPDLEALSQCEAVALFIQRAQAVKADFALTAENAAAIAAICQQLDGLPLAIELAAGRSKLFSPQALLPRLRTRLTLLVGGARDLPLRQQTLHGTIAWSYDLLEEAEKKLFRRLAVFVEGCTLEAAEAVCNAGQDLGVEVLDGVARMVDKSLLRQEEQADGEPRLLMLETIREYAVERLSASGETEAIRRRHAGYYAALAEEAERIGSGQGSREAHLERESANGRAALHWTYERGEVTLGLRLATWFGLFWTTQGQMSEANLWLSWMLALDEARGAQAASPAVRSRALYYASRLTMHLGRRDRALALAEEALALAERTGDQGDISYVLALLGSIVLATGSEDEAAAYFTESYAAAKRAKDAGDTRHFSHALLNLGELARKRGDVVRATEFLEEALADVRAIDMTWGIANILTLLGHVARGQQDYERAKVRYRESLALYQRLGNATYTAWCLEGIAAVACAQGSYQPATRLCAAAAALRVAAQTPLPPTEQDDFDKVVMTARAELDERTFTEEWRIGSTMTRDDAISYALMGLLA